MIDSHPALRRILEEHNVSFTKPRATVIETLSRYHRLTVAELISKTKGMVDRASVYRAVSLFEELGLIRRISQGWKYTLELSEQLSHHHHHLVCENCGQVVSFTESKNFDMIIETIVNAHAFRPSSHQLEIRGLCKDCIAEADKHVTKK